MSQTTSATSATSAIQATSISKSYPHFGMEMRTVMSEAERCTDRYTDFAKGQLVTAEAIYTPKNLPAFACAPELYDLMQKVSEAMPGVEFAPRRDSWVHAQNCFLAVSVYRPCDLFAMGALMYRNSKFLSNSSRGYVDDSADPKFVIMSPFIKNNAYSDKSGGYHSYVTSKIDIALRKAKKFLRSYPPADCAYLLSRKFISEATAHIRTLYSQYLEERRNLFSDFNMPDIAKALYAHTNKKADAVTPSFIEESLNKYLESMNSYQEENAKAISAKFVMVRANGSVAVVPVEGESTNLALTPIKTPIIYESVSALPEDIQSAIAVLSMLAINEFVQGLGMKLQDTAYWVMV